MHSDDPGGGAVDCPELVPDPESAAPGRHRLLHRQVVHRSKSIGGVVEKPTTGFRLSFVPQLKLPVPMLHWLELLLVFAEFLVPFPLPHSELSLYPFFDRFELVVQSLASKDSLEDIRSAFSTPVVTAFFRFIASATAFFHFERNPERRGFSFPSARIVPEDIVYTLSLSLSRSGSCIGLS